MAKHIHYWNILKFYCLVFHHLPNKIKQQSTEEIMNIGEEKINFKVARDFGETFNISINFLRQNFLPFFICLLLLAGPFILIYSFVVAHYESVILDKNALVKAGLLYNVNTYNWEYFISILLQFISYLSMTCTTYSYMIVYSEKGKGNFTVADVVRKMNSNIGKIIGGFILFFLIVVIFIVAIFFIIGIISGTSPIIAGLLAFASLIGSLLVAPNIVWQLNTLFLVIIADDEIPMSAYGRTRIVMKDNYWWTWLIVVCSTLIVSVLSLLFAIPSYVYTLFQNYSTSDDASETSILYIFTFATCTFLATLVYSLFYIISSFHYFSLAEKKDGKGLLERINEIGKIQTNTTEQTF